MIWLLLEDNNCQLRMFSITCRLIKYKVLVYTYNPLSNGSLYWRPVALGLALRKNAKVQHRQLLIGDDGVLIQVTHRPLPFQHPSLLRIECYTLQRQRQNRMRQQYNSLQGYAGDDTNCIRKSYTNLGNCDRG